MLSYFKKSPYNNPGMEHSLARIEEKYKYMSIWPSPLFA